jgi:hypothetical protein
MRLQEVATKQLPTVIAEREERTKIILVLFTNSKVNFLGN